MCKICNHVWYPRWSNLNSGFGCPKCSRIKSRELHRLTLYEVKKRVNKCITILSKNYVNNTTPLQCECKICKHKWYAKWSNLNHGFGCPNCGRLKSSSAHKLTPIEALRRLKRSKKNIVILSKYLSAQAPLTCKCKLCDHVWETSWASLRKGSKCPKCTSNVLTEQQVLRKINRVHLDVKLVSAYRSYHAKLECKCSKCSKTWQTTLARLLKSRGCPTCNEPKIEKMVRCILQKLTGWKFPKANPSSLPWSSGLTLDGYNRKHKIAFEYQGPQHTLALNHFGGLNRLRTQKKRDWRKRFLCRYHGIVLITVPNRINTITRITKYLMNKLTKLKILFS